MYSCISSKRAGGIENSAKLIQFPICEAFATASHKFQGQTVPRKLNLIIDTRHIWGPDMGYVMLSGVLHLYQLFVIEQVDEKNVYPDPTAL